jgi:hypothetical protein
MTVVSPWHSRRVLASAGLIACLAATQPGTGAEPPAPAGSVTPGEARILASLELQEEPIWAQQTDTGLFHVLTGAPEATLYTVDLLDPEANPIRSVRLPGVGPESIPISIPASSLVLIPKALGGLKAATAASQASSPKPPGGGSSYLVDTLTGEFVWQNGPLPPFVSVFYYPEEHVLILGSEDPPVHRALDLRTGNMLWSRDLGEARVRTRGRFLDVLAAKSSLIDVRTGQAILTYTLPVQGPEEIITLATPDRILLRDGKLLRGYKLPPLPAGPETVESALQASAAQQIWEHRAPKKRFWMVGDLPLGLRPATIPGDLLELWVPGRAQVLDGLTGKLLWEGKPPGLAPSSLPTAKAFARVSKEGIAFASASEGGLEFSVELQPCAKGWMRPLRWLGEDDLLVGCFTMKNRSDTGLVLTLRSDLVVSYSGRAEKWRQATPPAAEFRLTSSEKAAKASFFSKTLFKGFLAVVNPIAYVGAQLGEATVATLRSRGAVFRGVEVAASIPEDSSSLAGRRYLNQKERLAILESGRAFYVAGKRDSYEIIEQNLDTGALRILSTYRREKVNEIGFAAPYPIALSLEDNGKSLRVLSVNLEVPPAPPGDLLP